MKRIQYIGKQGSIFRLNINGLECVLIKTSLYVGNELYPHPQVVKGSTLGWNFGNDFISYNQIKKAINVK